MNNDNRYPVTASLFMLREMKRRHEQVHRGHELLKRKAEALRLRSRQAAADLCDAQGNVVPRLREAYICLAAAKFANGENNPNAMVLENVGQALVRVRRVQENTSGVMTVSLLAVETEALGAADSLRLVGLAVGGHRLGEARRAFRLALLLLIRIASLRSTCVLLDAAVRSTMRKVNGISKVIIPKLQNTEKYIIMEMDEREREEFHRLKMVKAKKLRTQAIEAAVENIKRNSLTNESRCKDHSITGARQHVSAFRANEHVTGLLYPGPGGGGGGGSRVSSAHTDSGGDDVCRPSCLPHYWDDEDLLF